VPAGTPTSARGIAFGGDCGVARVDLSTDGGKSRRLTQLGADQGTYGFRQWQTQFTLPAHGMQTLMVRCSNAKNETQPDFRTWNPAGYCSILLKRPMWLRSKGEPGMLRAVLPMVAVLSLIPSLHPGRAAAITA
jgi:hypothetical protein